MQRRKFLKLLGLGTASAPFVVKTALGEKETPTEENPHEDIMDETTEEGKAFLDHYEEGLKVEGTETGRLSSGDIATMPVEEYEERKEEVKSWERFYSGESDVRCGQCGGRMLPAMKIMVEEKRGYLYVCFGCKYQTEVAI
jgi:hypothetical protein